MTINKSKIHILKNTREINKQDHQTETMALLKQLLDRKGWNQRKLAKELNRDTTTVNRWSKNSRQIDWDNAEKIAKVIGCHPIEIYKPHNFVILKSRCTWNGVVHEIPKEDQYAVYVPYEYYHPHIKAILMQCPGVPTDGEIWLFDIPKVKTFAKNSIGKICYIEPSKLAIKEFKKIKKDTCVPIVALLKGNGDGTLALVNSYTNEPINEHCHKVPTEFLGIVSPVKARYDPELLNNINK